MKKILHVDFLEVFDDKEVKMIIPVKFEGNSPGVRLQGGILSKNKRKLFVKALPKNLPDFIKADISTLNLNDKITIEDLKDENYSLFIRIIWLFVKSRCLEHPCHSKLRLRKKKVRKERKETQNPNPKLMDQLSR